MIRADSTEARRSCPSSTRLVHRGYVGLANHWFSFLDNYSATDFADCFSRRQMLHFYEKHLVFSTSGEEPNADVKTTA